MNVVCIPVVHLMLTQQSSRLTRTTPLSLLPSHSSPLPSPFSLITNLTFYYNTTLNIQYILNYIIKHLRYCAPKYIAEYLPLFDFFVDRPCLLLSQALQDQALLLQERKEEEKEKREKRKEIQKAEEEI